MPLSRSPAVLIIVAVSVMLSLSMGVRQSLGLFLQPLTGDIDISIAGFTLAIAVQNLMWGLFQPVAGAMAVRFGFRCCLLYTSPSPRDRSLSRMPSSA